MAKCLGGLTVRSQIITTDFYTEKIVQSIKANNLTKSDRLYYSALLYSLLLTDQRADCCAQSQDDESNEKILKDETTPETEQLHR